MDSVFVWELNEKDEVKGVGVEVARMDIGNRECFEHAQLSRVPIMQSSFGS
jgi:hypothetical protein